MGFIEMEYILSSWPFYTSDSKRHATFFLTPGASRNSELADGRSSNRNDANTTDIWGLRTNINSDNSLSQNEQSSQSSTRAVHLPTGPALVNPRAARIEANAGIREGHPLLPPPPPSALDFFVPDNLAFTLYIVRAQDSYPPLGPLAVGSAAERAGGGVGGDNIDKKGSGEELQLLHRTICLAFNFAILKAVLYS